MTTQQHSHQITHGQPPSKCADIVMPPNDHDFSSAKTLHIPTTPFLAIEHPCIIRDIPSVLGTLGPPSTINDALEGKDINLTTSLRPSDPYARPLPSHRSSVDYILLRTVLPRRTGRRRRKGTNDPFIYPAPHNPSVPGGAEHLLSHLRHSSSTAQVEVIGKVKSAHRFRSLPDFQLVEDAVVVQRVQGLREATVEKVKAVVSPDVHEGEEEIVGPPAFGAGGGQSAGGGYMYRQTREKGKQKKTSAGKGKGKGRRGGGGGNVPRVELGYDDEDEEER